MANRERGEMPLVIRDRRYVLRLTTSACCELEDFTDGKRNWDQVWDGMKQGSHRDARLFLWVALRDKHPDIATDDPACLKVIGDLIDQAGGITLLLIQIRALMLLNIETMRDEADALVTRSRPPMARVRTGGASTVRRSQRA